MMLLNGVVLGNFEGYAHKGIYHIVFNHQKRPYNFFDTQTLDEFEVLLSLVEAGGYRGLIIKSGKPVFIVGANIKDIAKAHDSPSSVIDGFVERGQSLFNRLEDLPIPSVAIINGIAMGGGLELALACTSRLLVKDPIPENPKYNVFQLNKLSLPEVKLGILPAWGGTTRLPRIIYPTKAIELICTGRNIKQQEALRVGLVDDVVERHKILDSAYDLIYSFNNDEMLEWSNIRNSKIGPTKLGKLRANITYPIVRRTIGRKQKKMFGDPHAYPSPYEALEVLRKGRTLYRDESLKLERETFVRLVKSEKCRELVRKFLNGERG